MRGNVLKLTAFLAVLAGAGQAAAQEQSPADGRDDIIVTGERQQLDAVAASGALGDRSVLDTPFSVTVIDAAEIAERQPTTIAQLFVNDPSVFSFASAGTVNWWGAQIRGLGVRNYYVDDTPLLLYWGGDYPLEAVETVQALKGATGFMYGFGAPGGAISYQTKQPTAAPMATTEVGFRGHSVLTGHVDAGGPVGETGLGYRFNLAAEGGREYNEAELFRGLASLATTYAITPNLTWRANVAYENYDLGGEPFHIYWDAFSGDDLPAVPDNWDNLHSESSFYRYALWTAGTGLDWRLNSAWRADVRLGYTNKLHLSNKLFINIDNSAGDYTGWLYQFADREIARFAQAMLHGDIATGPIRHELVLGASLQNADSDFGDNSVYDNFFNGNIFQPQPYRPPASIDENPTGFPYKEQQTGVFLSDTLYFGDHWQAIVGLRHTYYDQEDVDGDPTTSSGYTTTADTPTLALLYKPTPNATIYASYVESLEGGGIVMGPPAYANEGEALDATVSTQYEVGAKYESDRLSLTAAGFRIERVETMDVLRGADRYLTQDGLSVYQGVELIGQLAVTDDLTLGLGAIHLDATLEDVSDENAALRGHRPGEAAEWQIVGNAEYNVPGISGLTLHGTARYYGEAPTNVNNDLFIPSYTLVTAGFSYAFPIGDRQAHLVGNLNNALDERYWGLQNFGETINGSLSLSLKW